MSGTTLGPYRLLEELGSGAMGRVWRAETTKPTAGLAAGVVVAIKVVHPHLLESAGFFKRFLREADLGRRIVHENVVRTLDADALVFGGVQHHFLVMEHVEGQTLRKLHEELERVPEELCRRIALDAARGLAAIHALGVVHRDLKPENVLITREHSVKVMDLGLARLADESAARLSQSGAFVGSVRYAAPEQFVSVEIDGRADLHALGVILYELSTNVHPYEARDAATTLRRILHDAPRRCAEINPQLSPFFEELVHRLLAKNRDDRFATAGELAEALEAGEESKWWKEHARALRTATHRPLRRIRIPRDTALYGRDRELALLHSLYERASRGEGQVVLVEGEGGIGKSRLVDEFVGRLQQEGEDVNFLYGSYPPGGAATASGAFSTAYREQFGDDLEAALAIRLDAAPALIPAFAALLRGEPAPSGVEPLTKDSLQTCFVHATRSLAAERPTIVLIDDLHFAPEEGRALFAALAMATPSARLLLVGTKRPDAEDPWAAQLERVGAARMPLARLGAKDVGALLIDAFRSEKLAEELGFRIVTKSDGNPFFVFEILRGLREGDFIRRTESGSWITSGVLADIKIPSTILDLVQARLSDLDEEDKDLLDVAACCGFEFDPVLVAEALGMAQIPAMKSFARIEKKRRLVRSAGRRFVFDHHQVQEAIYAGMSELLREPYHAAIASALETRRGAAKADPATLDGALCVDLAEHFLKGAQGARAARYLDAALTHLEKGWLNDAAVRLAARALAAPGLAVGVERAKLLVRKAARLDMLGRLAEQRVALDEALALADAAGDAGVRGRVRHVLGRHLMYASKLDEAKARLCEAIELARAAGDRATEMNATNVLGNVAHSRGLFDEARRCYEESTAMAQALGDRRGFGATGNLGLAMRDLGRFEEARQCFERHLANSLEFGDRRGEATASQNLGMILNMMGRPGESLSVLERTVKLSREIGDRLNEANATANLGAALLAVGRVAEALERNERHLELSREIGSRVGVAVAHVNLAPLRVLLGDLEGARADVLEALARSREIGERRVEGYALHRLALIERESGHADEARRRIDEALALRRAIGYRGGLPETLIVSGALHVEDGREDEAREALAEAAEIARDVDLPGDLATAAAHLARLPGGDVAAALAAFAAAADRLGVEGSMEARFLLWKATRDPAHLAQAKRLLDVLVAHAPPDRRASMVENVRLHRAITRA